MCCAVLRLSRPVGQQMAELPVEPRLAAALLAGGRMGCAEEVATVVAMLGVQSVWAGARNDRKALDEAKLRSAGLESGLKSGSPWVGCLCECWKKGGGGVYRLGECSSFAGVLIF